MKDWFRLLTADERHMLQNDAIVVGKILIDYIIRRYAFKTSRVKTPSLTHTLLNTNGESKPTKKDRSYELGKGGRPN